MRIVVEAMCAEFGGIRTYVEHLLDQWHDVHPDDELHVLVPVGSSLPTAGHERHEIEVRRPASFGRPLAQTTSLRQAVRRLRPDAVLATLPSTTLLHPGVPMAVVLYDLRHELRPEQFTRKRRLMRRVSYARGYQLADGLLSISRRSLDDLHERHPRHRSTPADVAYLGADHVRSWPAATRVGPSITFGHHSNKNVDLILDGWSELLAAGDDVPPLQILGVGGARERLAGLIEERGLTDHVTLAPFLPDDAFQRVMAEAEMIVFPSDFEGFGLPVVEGMYLDKPVVIGPERATTEIAGGHAHVMTDWTPAALATAVRSARSMTPAARAAAQAHGREFTWVRTVEQTRSMLVSLVEARATPRA